MYSNIIEEKAEKSLRGPLINVDIARNKWTICALVLFWIIKRYSDISKRTKRSSTRHVWDGRKDEPKTRGEIPRGTGIYFFTQIFALRFRYPPQSEWKDKKNDYSRQDPCEQFNDKSIPRDSNSRSKELRTIRDERNLKQCRYCKNIGHEIEEYRKRQYNNSRNNSSENSRNRSRPADGPRVSPSRIRLVNVIDLGDRTGGRECRIAVINRKKCSASPIITICWRVTRTRFHARYGRWT